MWVDTVDVKNTGAIKWQNVPVIWMKHEEINSHIFQNRYRWHGIRTRTFSNDMCHIVRNGLDLFFFLIRVAHNMHDAHLTKDCGCRASGPFAFVIIQILNLRIRHSLQYNTPTRIKLMATEPRRLFDRLLVLFQYHLDTSTEAWKRYSNRRSKKNTTVSFDCVFMHQLVEFICDTRNLWYRQVFESIVTCGCRNWRWIIHNVRAEWYKYPPRFLHMSAAIKLVWATVLKMGCMKNCTLMSLTTSQSELSRIGASFNELA